MKRTKLREMKHLPELRLKDVALYAKPVEVAEVSFGGRLQLDLLHVAGLCELIETEKPYLVCTKERESLSGEGIAYFVSTEHLGIYRVIGKFPEE